MLMTSVVWNSARKFKHATYPKLCIHSMLITWEKNISYTSTKNLKSTSGDESTLWFSIKPSTISYLTCNKVWCNIKYLYSMWQNTYWTSLCRKDHVQRQHCRLAVYEKVGSVTVKPTLVMAQSWLVVLHLEVGIWTVHCPVWGLDYWNQRQHGLDCGLMCCLWIPATKKNHNYCKNVSRFVNITHTKDNMYSNTQFNIIFTSQNI